MNHPRLAGQAPHGGKVGWGLSQLFNYLAVMTLANREAGLKVGIESGRTVFFYLNVD